jgi:hypothetical protein
MVAKWLDPFLRFLEKPQTVYQTNDRNEHCQKNWHMGSAIIIAALIGLITFL